MAHRMTKGVSAPLKIIPSAARTPHSNLYQKHSTDPSQGLQAALVHATQGPLQNRSRRQEGWWNLLPCHGLAIQRTRVSSFCSHCNRLSWPCMCPYKLPKHPLLTQGNHQGISDNSAFSPTLGSRGWSVKIQAALSSSWIAGIREISSAQPHWQGTP